MDNKTKNEIITLYLTTELSQSEIGRKFSIKQPAVSKVISAYKNGTFVYNDTTVPEQSSLNETFILPLENVAECEQTISLATEIEQTFNEIETAEYEQTVSSTSSELNTELSSSTSLSIDKCENTSSQNDKPIVTTNATQTENTAECEQTNSPTFINKAKITFTNHGLWLNQFALISLENPNELSYSFDSETHNLYIEPFNETSKNPFYYCKAKCSKNYTKTANKQLINDIQEILEQEFKGNISINLNKDSFKINFKFNFENGKFIINIPTMISNVEFETL